MHINDLDISIGVTIKKFVTVGKVGIMINSIEGSCTLQENINELLKQANAWQMEFNLEMCEVMHFRKVNKQILGS